MRLGAGTVFGYVAVGTVVVGGTIAIVLMLLKGTHDILGLVAMWRARAPRRHVDRRVCDEVSARAHLSHLRNVWTADDGDVYHDPPPSASGASPTSYSHGSVAQPYEEIR